MVEDTEMVEDLQTMLSWTSFKEKEVRINTKNNKIYIPKLRDAKEAGGVNSSRCTLIITEGASATSLVMAGLSAVSSFTTDDLGIERCTHDFYGIYPLKGKIRNVKTATSQQIMENVEIKNLKAVLGLNEGIESMRYGRVLVMTDQDVDGFHIKGLLINLFHELWPQLLKRKSPFLCAFITPILTATPRKEENQEEIMFFFSEIEYDAWTKCHDTTEWRIRYYKGLGSHKPSEAMAFFKNFNAHIRYYVWRNDEDDKALVLAFCRKMAHERRAWISLAPEETEFYWNSPVISIRDFVYKELALYGRAAIRRCIPSLVDGFKPCQRKTIYTILKKGMYEDIVVESLAGTVAQETSYAHALSSLSNSIIGMVQNFVGKNNVNLLLEAKGIYGTRYSGGEDVGQSRYLSTRVSPLTRALFVDEDDNILKYLNEHGKDVEPEWYIPVIPTILLNGSDGIGVAWRSSIPNYNPKDIIENVRCRLLGEQTKPLHPWYRFFKGSIEENSEGCGYKTSGVFKRVGNTINITELPLGRWTEAYEKFLKDSDIIQEIGYPNPSSVDITINNQDMSQTDLELKKNLRLTSGFSLTMMNLFDEKGVLTNYKTPEDIFEAFYTIRLSYYEKRKQSMKRIILKEAYAITKLFQARRDVPVDPLTDDDMPFKRKRIGNVITKRYAESLSIKSEDRLKALSKIIRDLSNTRPEDMWLEDLSSLENVFKALDHEAWREKML